MADGTGALCRMRLQEFKEIGGGLLDDIPVEAKGRKPKLLTIHLVSTPADAPGFTESNPPTNVIDVATAVATETISSSALDNLTAGADGQKIRAIHIDGNDEIIATEIDGHPTDWTTFVLSTLLYKEIFHTYGSAWGTNDKDFAGNLDIRTIADTVFVQIAATKNESNGARFKVPDNHVAMLYGGHLTRRVVTIDEGIKIRLIYIDEIDGATGLVAADRTLNWLEFIAGPVELALTNIVEIPKGHMFESGTWIVPTHSSLVNLGELYELTLKFLIWKK